MCSETVGCVRKSASAAREKLPSSATLRKISRRRRSTRDGQWQPQPPPPQQPPPLGIEVATNPPSVFIPKTDSLREMSALAHAGQVTLVEAPGTYFSKSLSHARQRYSYMGIAETPVGRRSGRSS